MELELRDAHLGLRAAPEPFWESFYPNSLLAREQTSSAADCIACVPQCLSFWGFPWAEEKESLALR